MAATENEIREDLNSRVQNDFTFHPATDETGPKHDMMRMECRNLARIFVRDLPISREQSLALTKLEEAMFWANAAIARNQQEDCPSCDHLAHVGRCADCTCLGGM